MLSQTGPLGGGPPNPMLPPNPGGVKLCHLLSDEALLRRLSGTAGEDCVSALRALNLPDSFWTDEFKVVPCAKSFSHKWTLCPCAHIGETARRRCPRSIAYKAVLCPLVKAVRPYPSCSPEPRPRLRQPVSHFARSCCLQKKTCPLGDSCSYAHNVFEHWLHPSRYKTRLCSFGRNCNRSICFFAHSHSFLLPATCPKEGDEREYLLQLHLMQESGLLPPAGIHPITGAPISPLMGGGGADLGSALQHAMQRPPPHSGRASYSGVPDMLSARHSMTGLPDHHSGLMSARASMSGMPHEALLAARPSLSGVPEHCMPGGMHHGRSSINGFGEQAGLMAARTSVSGLMDQQMSGMLGGQGSGGMHHGRPSMSGVTDHANMLLSMSMQQGSMQRAFSSDLASPHYNNVAMQRALSSDLSGGGPNVGAAVAAANAAAAAAANAYTSAHNSTAAAMERAFSRELAAASGAAAAAAASMMERAYSQQRESASGAAAAASMMERAYSQQRESAGGGAASMMERTYSQQREPPGGGGTASAMERALTHSRSMGSNALDRALATANRSVNSVESDSLIQLRTGSSQLGGDGYGGEGGAQSFDPLSDPQAPPRLSDPGTGFRLPMMPVGPQSHHNQMGGRPSDSGGASAALGLLGSKDLAGFESFLPLVNNALASGQLTVPAVRRSNSGSDRVVSPPLAEAVCSPARSNGSRTPPSPTAALDAAANEAAAAVGAAYQYGHPPQQHHQHQQHFQHHQHHQLLRQVADSPPLKAPAGGGAEGAMYESMLRAAAAANGADVAAMGAAGVNQAYLSDLVSRLQDQGVNREQLVSSLSQLLAQLLSVSN
ncbi:Zinc finger CCCH domain-containing protein 56 [Tetrabaena socialis]|uniref:Zinc finger CCCH domain-containing protein 56 n=1 Tax=Tetrabaena socialis TaxID=47790 RepID=A0A2J7ZU56_9CHLO|nr:Zinc finger CCCH domain-containing protein 56 [Tetrabaena socialis]|eukprot:PNH03770.1 Zinc finger CCCH domain-containing protein 56 [Tetrabaena socialis]